MQYTIEYEHLKDGLVRTGESNWHFNQVKGIANKYRLELSDEDFKHFYKLQIADKDIRWLMNQMSTYERSLTEALITYITY